MDGIDFETFDLASSLDIGEVEAVLLPPPPPEIKEQDGEGAVVDEAGVL